jgi:nucleoside-diphosphate-sugar epimerase
MRIYVTGGTGFTGSQVVPLLIQHGHQVRSLYRPGGDRSHLSQAQIDWVEGDLSDARTLASSMKGSDALANIASLGSGHVDSILDAAKQAGIRRAIFISTTAIFTQLNARSKDIRLAAEQAIQNSGLDYTILRPTMIYGSPRDRNMWQLIRFLRAFPIVPVFGDGTYLQQPIHVDDVAQAVLSCLATAQTIGKKYNIAGRQPISYNEVIDAVARQLNKRIWKVHLPPKPAVLLLKLFERLQISFPIKAEQILRLNENKNFSYEAAHMDFGFDPLSFEDGIRLELSVSRRG